MSKFRLLFNAFGSGADVFFMREPWKVVAMELHETTAEFTLVHTEPLEGVVEATVSLIVKREDI